MSIATRCLESIAAPFDSLKTILSKPSADVRWDTEMAISVGQASVRFEEWTQASTMNLSMACRLGRWPPQLNSLREIESDAIN